MSVKPCYLFSTCLSDVWTNILASLLLDKKKLAIQLSKLTTLTKKSFSPNKIMTKYSKKGSTQELFFSPAYKWQNLSIFTVFKKSSNRSKMLNINSNLNQVFIPRHILAVLHPFTLQTWTKDFFISEKAFRILFYS